MIYRLAMSKSRREWDVANKQRREDEKRRSLVYDASGLSLSDRTSGEKKGVGALGQKLRAIPIEHVDLSAADTWLRLALA